MSAKNIVSTVAAVTFAAAGAGITVRGLDAANVPMAAQLQGIERATSVVDACTAVANQPVFPNVAVRVIRAGLGFRDDFATPAQVDVCVRAAIRTASYNEGLIQNQRVFGHEVEALRIHDAFRWNSIKRMADATAAFQRPLQAQEVKVGFNLVR